MDKDQVITVIKKNILSIIAGVVALLAIGFMLFWLNGKFTEVQQAAQLRAAKASEIQGLMTKQRPNIEFTSADPVPLGQFPTNRIIATGRETMEGVKAQADQVLEQAKGVNVRVPLGADSFEAAAAKWPLEGEEATPDRQAFKQAYATWINADNSRFNAENGDYGPGTLQAEMQATRPPTAADLEQMEAGLEARLKADLPQGVGADSPEFQTRLAEERVRYATGMKYRRAQLHLIYVDPNSAPGGSGSGFTVHPIVAAEQPTAVDCFNAQVGLWVQETVAENLVRANQEAVASLPPEQQNLLNAPVKHLMSVNVPVAPFGEAAETAAPEGGEQAAPVDTGAGLRPGTTRPPAGGAAEEEPAEGTEPEAATESTLPIDPTANIERQYGVSASGRPLHTPFYDLVQFRVRLRCAADSVPYVLKQLQGDSFLAVVNVGMTSVDPAVAARAGYVYGSGPVVELDLACEMPFLRTWLVDLMPVALQQTLSAADAPPAEEGL
jgi:hypothetical protein